MSRSESGVLLCLIPLTKSFIFSVPQVCPTCTLQNEPNRPGCEACTTERPKEYKVPPPGPLDTIPRGAATTVAKPPTTPQTGLQIKQIVKPTDVAKPNEATKPLGVPGTSKEIKAPTTVTKEKVVEILYLVTQG